MEIPNVRDAKFEFGEVLTKARRGAIGINNDGKPIEAINSATEYDEPEYPTKEDLEKAIHAGLADLQNGKVADCHEVIERKYFIGQPFTVHKPAL